LFKIIALILIIALLLLGAFLLFPLTNQLLPYWRFGDFGATFYPAARYLLRGENAYINDFTYTLDGTQHPPYNPIWILLAAVPLGTLPLESALGLRFLLDLAAVLVCAHLCARWVGIRDIPRTILLAVAPWLVVVFYSGQWSSLAIIGMLLCYWGLKHDDVAMISVGILLAAARPQITELVILATVLLAWRRGSLLKIVVLTLTCVVVFSLVQPSWLVDLFRLYIDRMIHPRPLDSILLLPGWPILQIVVIVASAIGIVLWVWRAPDPQPTTHLWAVLAGVGLISALHEFTYDWIILMMPLAWLLRDKRVIVLVIALYSYIFVWAFAKIGTTFVLPSPVILPSLTLGLVIVWPFLSALPIAHLKQTWLRTRP
jgi:hypothetical protein